MSGWGEGQGGKEEGNENGKDEEEPAGVKSGGRRIDGSGGAQRWQKYSHSAPE